MDQERLTQPNSSAALSVTRLIRFDHQLKCVGATTPSLAAKANRGDLFGEHIGRWQGLLNRTLLGERMSSQDHQIPINTDVRSWRLIPDYGPEGKINAAVLILEPSAETAVEKQQQTDRLQIDNEVLSKQIELIVQHSNLSIILHDIETDTQKLLAGQTSLLQRYPGMTVSEARAQLHSDADLKRLKYAEKHPGVAVIVAARVPGTVDDLRWNQFVFSPVFEMDGRRVQLLYRLSVDELMNAQSSLEQAIRFAEIETFEEDAQTGEGHHIFGAIERSGQFLGGEERLKRVPEPYRKAVSEALQQIGQRVEFPFLDPETNQISWFEQQTIREYINDEGRRILVGMSRCIDEEKSALHAAEAAIKELEVANQNALQAAKSKSEFLANMSHEIRTPLHAVLGLAQMASRAKTLEKAQAQADKIVSAGKSLQTIIDDVLDFSKMDAGKLELEHLPFDLQDTLTNLAVIMSKAGSSKSLDMAIHLSFAPTFMLVGDKQRLEQILINLVANAIKFTHQGSVILGVECVEQDSKSQKIRFSVQDTGIGISPEALIKIFTAFEQADTSTTRQFGGTGLGLTISLRLLDLMSSTFEVDSHPDKGSVFSFEIDFEIGEPVSAKYGSASLLIADDSYKTAKALSDSLSICGWDVQCVDNGQALVEAATKAHAHEPKDLLIIDWDMPDLDGLETAALLFHRLGAQRPKVAIMVNGSERELVEGLSDERFVDRVLEKPVLAVDLVNLLQDASVEVALGRSDARSFRPLSGYKILVVDDNEFNLEVAQHIFGGQGAKVICLTDGRQAIDWLVHNPNQADLIFMDIQMPVLDGLSATREIRETLGLDIPIIALSAAVFDTDRNAALDAGMSGFIAKPFKVEDALKTVLALSRVPISKLRSTGSQTHQEINTSEQAKDLLIDKSRALEFWESLDRLKSVLLQFSIEHQNTGLNIAGLTASEASAVLHKLKGSAGSLGLTALVVQISRLQRLLEDQAAPNKVKVQLAQLDITLGDTLDAIRRFCSQ